MPPNSKPRRLSLHLSIHVLSGSIRQPGYYTYGSIPLTPDRLKLVKRLAGSAQWVRQGPQRKVTWEEVEGFL